jgi:hypothetical protein
MDRTMGYSSIRKRAPSKWHLYSDTNQGSVAANEYNRISDNKVENFNAAVTVNINGSGTCDHNIITNNMMKNCNSGATTSVRTGSSRATN